MSRGVETTRQAAHLRDLNDMVHGVLVVGLAVSTVFLLVGLGLSLWLDHGLPAAVVGPGEALRGLATLRPVAFLSLGLMILIATPAIRVLGSVIVFLWERDWRYAAITLLVLSVMITSVLLGRG
jgi:uncharacterized membrane protein